MKIDPRDKNLEIRMGPSKFSNQGFLVESDLGFLDLIILDRRKVNELGLDIIKIYNELWLVYNKARDVFGAEIEIKKGFFAKFYEARGKIPSPFLGQGVFDKGEAILLDKNSSSLNRIKSDKSSNEKNKIIITHLGIEMIKSHSFFQGKNSRYRIHIDFIKRFISLPYIV